MARCLADGGSCCNGDGDGIMSFVGSNRGEWIAETTYKYVGEGKGEFNVLPEMHHHHHHHGFNWCHMVGLLVLLVVLAFVAMLFWPTGETTYECELGTGNNFLGAWSDANGSGVARTSPAAVRPSHPAAFRAAAGVANPPWGARSAKRSAHGTCTKATGWLILMTLDSGSATRGAEAPPPRAPATNDGRIIARSH
eukprot:CAMPEP_0170378332 /NCGR_PEP_ID=MMETSP0117_2-20130122/12753_1 /TAXON_ID=400756 /ORGANISM="Durinskia baltica, Strain CSIRO CS-38" /LENGTH=194 /DNA_ID=CAMNT_0010633697 /DNA_START=104 /DNA_END=686 /DNA_ORIENTATION=-